MAAAVADRTRTEMPSPHFRQAIVTKYYGPTDARGSRVKATAEAGSVTVGWDHALDIQENHQQAARALAKKYGWKGRWIGGGTKDGYCFVNDTGPAGSFTIAGSDDDEF